VARQVELFLVRGYGDRGACPYRRSLAYVDGGDQHTVRSDRRPIPDGGAMLVDAIVVGDDGARAYIDVGADGGIPDVGEVVGLGTLPDVARLHLDEVADVHLRGERRPRPQARIRADAAAFADRRAVDMTERLDLRARADRDIAQDAIRRDLDVVPELDR